MIRFTCMIFNLPPNTMNPISLLIDIFVQRIYILAYLSSFFCFMKTASFGF